MLLTINSMIGLYFSSYVYHMVIESVAGYLAGVIITEGGERILEQVLEIQKVYFLIYKLDIQFTFLTLMSVMVSHLFSVMELLFQQEQLVWIMFI